MFTLDWNAENCLELIGEYQKRPILWDKTAIGHKNRQRKALAWTEIAQKIGCSKQEVERKLNVLLTQYRRERQKIKMRFHECPQDPYSPSWYAFKAFAFLEDVRQPGKINKVRPSLLNFPTNLKITQNKCLSIKSNDHHLSIEPYPKIQEKQCSEDQMISSCVTPEDRPNVVLHSVPNQNGAVPEIRRKEPFPATKIFLPPSRANFETRNNNISRLDKITEKRKPPRKAAKERKELRNHLQMLMKKVMNEDECDFIGSNTTNKLRLMERSQRIIAEKLIGDVLFYGQVNKLSNSAEVIPSKDRIGGND